MPRALETAYALSAAPAHLRDSAGVYLLDPARGYVEARPSLNGFRCLVAGTEWNGPDLPFRDDVFVPVCSDAAGAARGFCLIAAGLLQLLMQQHTRDHSMYTGLARGREPKGRKRRAARYAGG